MPAILQGLPDSPNIKPTPPVNSGGIIMHFIHLVARPFKTAPHCRIVALGLVSCVRVYRHLFRLGRVIQGSPLFISYPVLKLLRYLPFLGPPCFKSFCLVCYPVTSFQFNLTRFRGILAGVCFYPLSPLPETPPEISRIRFLCSHSEWWWGAGLRDSILGIQLFDSPGATHKCAMKCSTL